MIKMTTMMMVMMEKFSLTNKTKKYTKNQKKIENQQNNSRNMLKREVLIKKLLNYLYLMHKKDLRYQKSLKKCNRIFRIILRMLKTSFIRALCLKRQVMTSSLRIKRKSLSQHYNLYMEQDAGNINYDLIRVFQSENAFYQILKYKNLDSFRFNKLKCCNQQHKLTDYKIV